MDVIAHITTYEDRTEYRNGDNQLHRLNGPAVEFVCDTYGEDKYFVDGIEYDYDSYYFGDENPPTKYDVLEKFTTKELLDYISNNRV